MKMSCIHIFRVLDREKREFKAEILFEKMLTKSCLNFITEKRTNSGSSANSMQSK